MKICRNIIWVLMLGVGFRAPAKRIVAAFLVLFLGVHPALATQWVTGTVSNLQECGATGCNGYGVILTLSNMTWLSGTTTNGPTACTSAFKITTGVLGVDENSKNRMFSILLAGYSQHNPVSILADTSVSGNFCSIQAVGVGANP